MLIHGCSNLKKSIVATAIIFALSGCDGSSSNNDVEPVDAPVSSDDPMTQSDAAETSGEATDNETGNSGSPGSEEDTDVSDENPNNEESEPTDVNSDEGSEGDAGTGENNNPPLDDDSEPTEDDSDEGNEDDSDTGENTNPPVEDENQPEEPVENELTDSDGDGIGDERETEIGINPNNPDTDGDGIEDGVDAFPNDPTANADSDGDGVDDSRDAFPDDATEASDLNGDGLGDNANPIEGAVLNGTVSNTNDSSVIEGATVNLDLISFDTSVDAVNRTTSDSNGEYQLIVDASLVPDSFIITASRAGFRPAVILADSDDYNDDDIIAIDISLTPASNNEVIIEDIPVVHHLGDDSFGGTANSQFQRSSEGPSYIRTFSLNDEQTSSLELTLVTAAKGIQRENEIYINAALVGTFPNTNSNGSYTLLEIPLALQQDLLVAGSNVIEIRSVGTGSDNGDIDDFEFVNISITGFVQ